MPTTIKKTKCFGCGKVRGHVPGCKFIPCAKCNVAGEMGHLPDCPLNPSPGEAPQEDKTRFRVDDFEDDDDGDGGEQPEFPPIVLIEGALDALQESLNSGDFAGDKQRQDQCEFETIVDGEKVQCPNIAAMKKIVKNHCPTCDRDKKQKLLALCIPHAINVWGGNAPSKVQMSLDLQGAA